MSHPTSRARFHILSWHETSIDKWFVNFKKCSTSILFNYIYTLKILLLFDYILYSKEHKQPKKSDIKIIPLKNDTNLKYYLDISKGLTSFIKSTKIKVNNNELSDHYPVVANFIF
jgi:hypothetical protein